MKKLILTLIISTPLLVLTSCENNPVIIAHRGSSHQNPENTLAAINLAWQQNADIVEIDVHLTKDNRIVVIHDYTTERTTGVDMEIKQTTSDKLRKLDVGSYKSEEFKGEKIPFLEEAIATIPPNKKLLIELKSDKTIVPYLREVVLKSNKQNQILFQSFHLESITATKNSMPHIPAFWLHGVTVDKDTNKPIPPDKNWIKIAKQNNLDGISLHWISVTEDFIFSANQMNLKIYAWTVDDTEIASKLKLINVNGIITNRPLWIQKNLN